MRKNYIDLRNPMLKPIIELMKMRCIEALDISLDFENSIFPIFALLKKNKPEHVGSGVLVKIKTEFFIFSASHVFDCVGKYRLLMGNTKGKPLLCLNGDRFSTPRDKQGKHQNDPLDASVYHILEDLPSDIQARALKYDDLDLIENADSNEIYIAAGYRLKDSYSIREKAFGKASAYPSIKLLLEDYSRLKLNKDLHVALAYEKKVLVNGEYRKSPKLVGLSGGGIIRIKETNIIGALKIEKVQKPLLSAITIEQKPERHNCPGAIVGTKVLVHLALIGKYMPTLLNDL